MPRKFTPEQAKTIREDRINGRKVVMSKGRVATYFPSFKELAADYHTSAKTIQRIVYKLEAYDVYDTP